MLKEDFKGRRRDVKVCCSEVGLVFFAGHHESSSTQRGAESDGSILMFCEDTFIAWRGFVNRKRTTPDLFKTEICAVSLSVSREEVLLSHEVTS